MSLSPFGCLLALLTLSVSLQASDKIALPSDAQRILEAMDANLNKARQTAVDGLEVELKNTMKGGKLEEANAIKEQIDSLKAEMSSESDEAKGKPTNDADLEAFIKGTDWSFEGNQIIRFHEAAEAGRAADRDAVEVRGAGDFDERGIGPCQRKVAGNGEHAGGISGR